MPTKPAVTNKLLSELVHAIQRKTRELKGATDRYLKRKDEKIETDEMRHLRSRIQKL